MGPHTPHIVLTRSRKRYDSNNVKSRKTRSRKRLSHFGNMRFSSHGLKEVANTRGAGIKWEVNGWKIREGLQPTSPLDLRQKGVYGDNWNGDTFPHYWIIKPDSGEKKYKGVGLGADMNTIMFVKNIKYINGKFSRKDRTNKIHIINNVKCIKKSNKNLNRIIRQQFTI